MMPEMQALLDELLKVQQKLKGSHKLAQARTGDGWNPDLWVLPLCPPTNSLYPGKARRYKSKAYKEWEELAEAYWLYQVVQKRGREHAPGPTYPTRDKQKWGLDVYSFMPTRRDGDLDGRVKALVDWLCHATGHDDRYLDRLHLERITAGHRLRGQVVIFGAV